MLVQERQFDAYGEEVGNPGDLDREAVHSERIMGIVPKLLLPVLVGFGLGVIAVLIGTSYVLHGPSSTDERHEVDAHRRLLGTSWLPSWVSLWYQKAWFWPSAVVAGVASVAALGGIGYKLYQLYSPGPAAPALTVEEEWGPSADVPYEIPGVGEEFGVEDIACWPTSEYNQVQHEMSPYPEGVSVLHGPPGGPMLPMISKYVVSQKGDDNAIPRFEIMLADVKRETGEYRYKFAKGDVALTGIRLEEKSKSGHDPFLIRAKQGSSDLNVILWTFEKNPSGYAPDRGCWYIVAYNGKDKSQRKCVGYIRSGRPNVYKRETSFHVNLFDVGEFDTDLVLHSSFCGAIMIRKAIEEKINRSVGVKSRDYQVMYDCPEASTIKS